MSTWHRVIRLVMILIFVPTAVLAATPLAYCVSTTSAHRALEYVYLPGPGHHSLDDGEQARAPIVCNETVAASPGDTCLDFSVLTAVQPKVREGDTKLLPCASAAKVKVALSEFGAEASQTRRRDITRLHIARILHPQLTELSVTKLLN